MNPWFFKKCTCALTETYGYSPISIPSISPQTTTGEGLKIDYFQEKKLPHLRQVDSIEKVKKRLRRKRLFEIQQLCTIVTFGEPKVSKPRMRVISWRTIFGPLLPFFQLCTFIALVMWPQHPAPSPSKPRRSVP